MPDAAKAMCYNDFNDDDTPIGPILYSTANIEACMCKQHAVQKVL